MIPKFDCCVKEIEGYNIVPVSYWKIIKECPIMHMRHSALKMSVYLANMGWFKEMNKHCLSDCLTANQNCCVIYCQIAKITNKQGKKSRLTVSGCMVMITKKWTVSTESNQCYLLQQAFFSYLFVCVFIYWCPSLIYLLSICSWMLCFC